MGQSRRRPGGISCKKVVRELTNYIEKLSDESLNIKIEKHIERCHNCRILLETTKKMIQFIGDEEAFLKAFEKHTKTELKVPSQMKKKPRRKKK